MILIAGDSWGCSEWPKIKPHLPYQRHGCLATYFQNQDHSVINVSVGGISNMEIATIVDNFLDNNHDITRQIQKIVVFQTGWSRDYIKKHALGLDLKQELSRSYDEIVFRFISRFYNKLSYTAQRYNKKIELIGGSADTMFFENFEREYPGLTVACQSMVNLIWTGNHRIDNPVLNLWVDIPSNLEFIALLKENLSSDDLKKLLDDIQLGETRQKVLESFNHDRLHVSHLEYKILFDFLQSNETHN